MSKDAKISCICHALAALVLAALLIVATYYDLAISKAIGDQSNFYGQFFAVYAEYPSYLVAPLCGGVFFYNARYLGTRAARIAFAVFAVVVCYAGWLIFGLSSTKLAEPPHLSAFAALSAALYTALVLALGRLVPEQTMRRMFKFAVFAVVFLLVALVVIRIMKAGWCRMRYRDMLKEGNFDGFTPWYRPMAGRDKLSETYSYTSFPSGHSSSIVHIYLVCVLCDVLPSMRKRWLKYTLYACATALCVVACVSRIVNCAHYLSDVVVGAGLTYLIFYGLKYIFFRDGKYTFGEITE